MKNIAILKWLGTAFFLVTPIVLGAIAWHLSIRYKIPVIDALPALTTILPIAATVTGGGTLVNLSYQSRGRAGPLPSQLLRLVNIIMLMAPPLLLAYSTMFLGNQNCRLKEQWQKWFSAHDQVAIRGMQQMFQCCGFGKVGEMPYPFPTNPDKNGNGAVPANTCQKLAGPNTPPCFPMWEEKVQMMGNLMVAANAIMILFKLSFWMFVGGRQEGLASRSFGRYSHYPTAEEVNDEDADGDENNLRYRDDPTRGRVTNGQENRDRDDSKSKLLPPNPPGESSSENGGGDGFDPNPERSAWQSST